MAKAKAAEAEFVEDVKPEGEAFGMDDSEGDGFVVDLSGVDDDGRPEAMPRGIYDAVVDDLTFDHSQSSGNPMWTWILKVEGGEYDGRTLYYHTVFTEKAVPRVKRALKNLQTDEGYAQALLETKFDPSEVADEGKLLGGRCRLKVTTRKYDNRLTNNVQDLLPPAAGDEGF